jgi:hypothetical protein
MTDTNNQTQTGVKLKVFFIKLISISISIVIIINFLFNMILSERIEKIDNILSITEKSQRYQLKEKIKDEINVGLSKENILHEDDKILLYKLFLKLKDEFKDLDKSKI